MLSRSQFKGSSRVRTKGILCEQIPDAGHGHRELIVRHDEMEVSPLHKPATRRHLHDVGRFSFCKAKDHPFIRLRFGEGFAERAAQKLDLVFPEGSDAKAIIANKAQIAVDEFYRLNLKVKDEKVVYGAKPLRTDKEIISVDAEDDAVVR